jgi:hypothetical protein
MRSLTQGGVNRAGEPVAVERLALPVLLDHRQLAQLDALEGGESLTWLSSAPQNGHRIPRLPRLKASLPFHPSVDRRNAWAVEEPFDPVKSVAIGGSRIDCRHYPPAGVGPTLSINGGTITPGCREGCTRGSAVGHNSERSLLAVHQDGRKAG